MKRIVVEHMVARRFAYPEIPDADFTAERLDHSYEQSFNHWKAKFAGKKSSGAKRAKTMGIREIEKILNAVGSKPEGNAAAGTAKGGGKEAGS